MERFCAKAAAMTGKKIYCLRQSECSQPSFNDEEAKLHWCLKIGYDSELPTQGYHLRIDETGPNLMSSDEAGAFYGLQTLAQILSQRTDSLPYIDIHDYPDFPSRGYMLDISRGKVPRLESLFELVERMAAFKLNHLQLYVEHTFAFADHETVWRDSSPLTAEDIRLLDSHCRAHFIELVPNLNSFGHFGKWLKHPQYRHLAECPDGYESAEGKKSPHGTTLKPDDDSLRLLEHLYSEYLPLFSSDKFNVGCDETWELGLGWSRPMVEKTNISHVYFEFLKKIHALVIRHDRRMMFWADMILKTPAYIAELPNDATALIWGYEADHPFQSQCEQLAGSSLPFYVAPGTSSWLSLGGRLDNALANIDVAISCGLACGADGAIITDWGDGGHHQFPSISYPTMIYFSALSWQHGSNNNLSIEDVLNLFIFRDPDETTARAVLDLGRTCNLIDKKIKNSSPLFHMLFCKKQHLDNQLSGISEEELKNVCHHLRQIENSIEKADPRCTDATLIKREISLTVKMLLYAARRGLSRLTNNPSFGPNPNPLQEILLVKEFEECWMSRNRSGGLTESSKRLLEALA